MPVPFGFSAGDIIPVIQVVFQCYRDCRSAGGIYRDIAHLAWSLHAVLSTIQTDLESNPSSPLNHTREGKRHLAESIRGCEAAVDEVMTLLESYGSLNPVRESSRVRRVWDPARYVAAQVDQQLQVVRSHLTIGITMIMLQLDVSRIFLRRGCRIPWM